MASEFLFSFAVEQMLTKLSSFAADEISCAWGLKAELKRMAESTRRIKAAVQDAEDKQAEDDRVRPWLLKLQEVVFAAEDVMDKFAYESLRRKVEFDQNQLIKGQLYNFFSCSNPVVFRLRMAHQVKEINELLAGFEKQAESEFKLRLITATICLRAPPGGQLDRETDSRLDVSQVPIGREADVSTIINMLDGSSPPSQQLLTVVSVVGMGGLGKTTLAKLVFNRAKELKLFGHTIWYCVSEDFDHKKILRGMLEALGQESAGSDVERMLDRLDNKLQGENFLLVLDDVWNEDSKKWYSLKDRLEKVCKKSGNVVLVTTRSKSAASKMETQPSHMHELKGLSNDECWSIIKQQVCKNDRVSITCELEMLGKAIAERCGGVPLAAAVVGGILRSKGVESWSSIKENKVWDEVEQSDGIMPILKLSFDGLSSSLKQCFAYCSLFPKDYQFEKTELVQMWMAEGFVEVSTNRERKGLLMEEIGDVYFNDLLANSFFQDTIKDSLGNITYCKMHDLFHDLAVFVSKLETFIINVSSKVETSDASPFRRLNLTCDNEQQMQSVQGLPQFLKDGARKLHSFFSNVDVFRISPNFKSLRTLSLYGVEMKELPESIGKLKHLRYIDISLNFQIEKLPRSITKLYNLQTLRLLYCRKINELPKEVKNLVSLRHIYFNNSRDDLMLAEVGRLTNLQTLPVFVVGVERGYKIEELGGLKELRGDLRIVGLGHVRDGEEAASAKLHEKKLSSLYLEWSSFGRREISFSSSSYKDEQVLEGLLLPPSLQHLQISCYKGKKLPSGSWMPTALVELELSGLMECEKIPTLGHLPHLKFLQLSGMRNLKSIGVEFYVESGSSRGGRLFPSLKKFTLRYMTSLVEWVIPVAVNGGDETLITPPLVVFPYLDELVIEASLCLESLPSAHNLKSLKVLKISYCDKLTSLPKGLQFCTSLQILYIMCCGGLTSFPEDILGGNLTQLKELFIGAFWKELEEFPGLNSIYHLSASLKKLSICGWGKLKSLPHQLQHLTSLTCLSISYFDGLKVLPDWIGNLSSLDRLEIWYCRNLTSLLTATSMQHHLSKLMWLDIVGCPLLKERCAKNSGLEWSNISHIPTIEFDLRRIHH